MEVDKNKLYRLIFKAIKQLDEEKNLCRNKRLYVVFPDQWKQEYGKVLQAAEENYQLFTVVSAAAASEKALQNLYSSNRCGAVLKKEQVEFASLPPGTTVFPVVPRDLLVKTALCISDTFETKWVRNSLENGWKIIFLKQGIDPLTGREPKAYADRIRRYLRIVSEYGIELRDHLLEKGFSQCLPQSEQRVENRQAESKRRPRVITAGELDGYETDGILTLGENDLITELAREQAEERGIKVVRKKS